MTPDEDLAGAREATARLLEHLDALPPEDLRAPSLLPGWSRAHVVAHLAGNALSHVRMLDGCLAAEVRSQYEGGAQAREASIDELAREPAAAVEEHRRACALLAQRWDVLRPEHWARDVLRLDRGPEPAVGLAWARWREVEMHRVDLAAGYRPSDWAPPFARRLLEELLERTRMRDVVLVDGVADGGAGRPGPGVRVAGPVTALAAWLSGRSDGSDLRVAGGDLPTPPPWT